MIGIQGENGLEEVTKSPCDTSLDANSTNAVENRVVTQAINEINSDLAGKVNTSSAIRASNCDIWVYTRNIKGIIYVDGVGYGDSNSSTDFLCLRADTSDTSGAAIILCIIISSNNPSIYGLCGIPLSNTLHHGTQWNGYFKLSK